MRRQFLRGAVVVLSVGVMLAGCDPYYYGRSNYAAYNGYGYSPYGYMGYGAMPYGAPPPYPASYAPGQMLSAMSYNFVINAALSDMYERQAGSMAAQKGVSPQIRGFGDRMLRDHNTTTQQMMATLQNQGIQIVPPGVLDPRHQTMVGELTTAQGADFDRRFAVQQVAAHREAVAMIQMYAQSGDNPALKQLAQQTLPMIQDHLRMAQMLPGAAGT